MRRLMTKLIVTRFDLSRWHTDESDVHMFQAAVSGGSGLWGDVVLDATVSPCQTPPITQSMGKL